MIVPIFSAALLSAQVPNDDIENRLSLDIEQIVSSTTRDCTVQANCVDESLTGKCIDYHNDQWFTFNSHKNSTLYINILGQKCRDLKGVQLVVLKGEPCNTETYEILTCVSLATQDDIYVESDSLEKNQEYLINIDGYLHDFCAFQMEVSATPRGFSPEPVLNLTSNPSRSANVVHMDWAMPDSMGQEIREFEIYKRVHPNFKSEYLDAVPVVSNAFGEFENHYSFEDSIEANTTVYYTLAAKDIYGKSIVFANYKFHYRPEPNKPRQIPSIKVPLENLKNNTPVGIMVYDFHTKQLLDKHNFAYKKGDLDFVKLTTYKFTNIGVYKLLVLVIDYKKQTKQEYIYDLLMKE